MAHPSCTPPALFGRMVATIAEAVPGRGRWTFLELLVGASVTVSGHVTQAIVAAGQMRSWSTYFWFVERARWSWLAVWRALLVVVVQQFAPAVWLLILDDTLVERSSPRAPGCRRHFNHTTKPNRPRFLLSQSWVCLAVVLEGGGRSGAVPLMLRLMRATGQRSKLAAGRLLLRLLGGRLGAVCLLLDAWYMRARLIRAALARGHCVIGRVRKDLALYLEPPQPPPGRRGRPRTYGDRLTPERVACLPVQRSARILYGRFQVIRYRTCCVAARFLQGELVRAVWVELERDDRPGGYTETRLLLCTDPLVPALEVILRYSRRWSIEPLFFALKHGWGLKDAWQRSRQVLMRWATLVSVSYALVQILTSTDPAQLAGVAQPAPWRPPGTLTAGIVRAGLDRILRRVGVLGLLGPSAEKLPPPTPRRSTLAADTG